MEEKRSLTQVVEQVLQEFPTLESVPVGHNVEIRLKSLSESHGDEADELVGTYSTDAMERGEITESDIREDCKAFLSEWK